ncbi:MAG: efflux RND transporter periplasmic adaptor subunit [Gammaproteobacteria bacterium]|nr:MAG: efflux RND transporter periplasmic adaptor subunit [Gammaproteobacteria bacterium]
MRNDINLRVAGIALALLLAGCEQANTYVEPPPPKVTVARPLVQEVIDYLEFTGTTVASEQVEVRARVAGVLESMHFQPGTQVKKGDLLFVIDPKEYQADLKAAQAELASAQAKLERAQKEFARAQKLFKQQAGSDVEVVKWRGEQQLARAAIERANADIARAELNLGYTRVTALISGRVGRNRVDVGNLVGQGEATVLTEVTDYDPMYVYFNLNELDLLRVQAMYRAEVKNKGPDPAKDRERQATIRKADIQVYLGLADEEGYPHEGVLDFAESGVDPDTGTIQLRAVFKNGDVPPALIPGLFARVRLPIAKRPDMPLVSDRAINADQSGRYLLIVNSENVVEKHNVRLGQLVDGLRVIEEGLRKDDWVVVNGIQRARPGGKADPEKIDMASLTASALREAASAEKKQNRAADSDTSKSQQKQQ